MSGASDGNEYQSRGMEQLRELARRVARSLCRSKRFSRLGSETTWNWLDFELCVSHQLRLHRFATAQPDDLRASLGGDGIVKQAVP